MWFFSARFDGFHPDTWVVRGGYIDEDVPTQYLAALYWSL
jgi:hypothetical protein